MGTLTVVTLEVSGEVKELPLEGQVWVYNPLREDAGRCWQLAGDMKRQR